MESTMPKRQELDDDDESSKRRSPEKAMEEIRKQDTHDLYCPKCTRNITKTAQLVEKGDEFSPDNQKPFVLWIPIFTPFKFLSSSPTGSVESNSSNLNQSVDNNSSNPNPTGPVDNISANSNSNGPVKNNSSNPYSSGSVDKNYNPSPSDKMEEKSVTNKEKDTNAGHQSYTSPSGTMKSLMKSTSQKYLGWLYHH